MCRLHLETNSVKARSRLTKFFFQFLAKNFTEITLIMFELFTRRKIKMYLTLNTHSYQVNPTYVQNDKRNCNDS